MNDERGLTLIELLAVIVILSILSASAWGLFFNSQKNYDRLNSKNILGQETNIIISSIKNYHQRYDSYVLYYQDNSLYLGEDKNSLILISDNVIDFKIGVKNFNELRGEKKINSNSPLFIYFKLQDKDIQCEFDTIINRY